MEIKDKIKDVMATLETVAEIRKAAILNRRAIIDEKLVNLGSLIRKAVNELGYENVINILQKWDIHPHITDFNVYTCKIQDLTWKVEINGDLVECQIEFLNRTGTYPHMDCKAISTMNEDAFEQLRNYTDAMVEAYSTDIDKAVLKYNLHKLYGDLFESEDPLNIRSEILRAIVKEHGLVHVILQKEKKDQYANILMEAIE